MSITIKDIAKIAGVSHSTVSRSLNDSPRVAQVTKDRIKKIAEEVGFEFNANARSLSTARTNTIGIIYKSQFDDTGHFFSSSIQNLMRNTLEKHDLDTIITTRDEGKNGENNIIRLINKKKVDGLIIMETSLDAKTMSFIRRAHIPVVFCQRPPEVNSDFDTICCDHFTGGYEAGRHLIQLGHKGFACIQRKDNTKQFQLRTKGFIAALKDGGISSESCLLTFADRSLEGGYTFVQENLLALKGITGLFVHTDAQALGIIEALKEKGFLLPNDFSIVGYDDIALGSFYKPYLTTVHQPIDKIALLTCERLVHLLSKDNSGPQQLYLPPRLIKRESTVAMPEN